jgi:integrase
MAHIQIPHTIKRNNTYYLNLRTKGKVSRYSLKTKDTIKALGYIHSIVNLVAKKGGSRNMDDIALRELVDSVIGNIARATKAMVYSDSEEAKQSLKSYCSSYESAFQNANHDYPISSTYKLDTYNTYKLNNVYREGSTPEQKASTHIKGLVCGYTEDDDGEYHQFEPAMIELDDKLSGIYKQAKSIREYLSKSDINQAILALEALVSPNEVLKRGVATIPEQENLPPLKDYIKGFIDSRTSGTWLSKTGKQMNPWSDEIYNENTSYLEILSLLIGDVPLNLVDGQVLDRAFRDVIVNLPLGNRKPYNKMAPTERAEQVYLGVIDDSDVITGKTAFQYKKLLMSFFSYTRDQYLIKASPTSEMRLVIERSSSNIRGAFDDHQVKRIISYCKSKKDHQKWAPIIMAYTGARCGEIMQLRKEDIKTCKDSGIHYILITKDAGKLKTSSSQRKVPIHSKLIDMGFLGFVAGSGERLFCGDGKTLTRFYEQIQKHCDLPPRNELDELLSLYSLRHSVITKLQEENINEATTQQVVGHKKQTNVTNKNYTHKFKLAKLEEAVGKINYN